MPLTWSALLDELRRADLLVSAPAHAPDPLGLGVDSRTATAGMLYVAVRGSQSDGHRFVADAVRRGATATVVEGPHQTGVPEIVVRDSRRAALVLGSAWYGHPSQDLTLIGVTGTNGKTTTTGLIRHLFNEQGTAGSIGTLGAFDGRGSAVTSTAGSLTTPGPIDLQATFASMVARGATHVVMEASSHSLDQGRLDGLAFAAGVFTNVTHDHLDYHGTMEAYLASKLRLSTLLRLGGVEVVNLDDDAWCTLPARTPRLTFGLHPAAEVRATDVVLDSAGSRFHLNGRFGSVEVMLPLLGDFNVANALAAAATAWAAGAHLHDIRQGLRTFTTSFFQAPGRLNLLDVGGVRVVIDYCHNVDGMRQLADFVKRMMDEPLTRAGRLGPTAAGATGGRTGRAIGVIGIPGDRRDDDQREYGALAATAFDEILVREDKHLRGREPGASAANVVDGVRAARAAGSSRVTRAEKILDELSAVRAALRRANPGDLVVMCVDDAIAVHREAMAASGSGRGATAFADPGELEAPEG
jgi:UDP-N-acetylmuramoyl-L-alanyl-D-glutamate--2,6-diaminopimelate ligase